MNDTNAENSGIDNNINNRRKRINRIKTAIVVIVVLLLILPTIFCIILGLRVSSLQKQIKELDNLHSQYGLIDDTGIECLAYAAEKPTSYLTDASVAFINIPPLVHSNPKIGQDYTAGTDTGANQDINNTGANNAIITDTNNNASGPGTGNSSTDNTGTGNSGTDNTGTDNTGTDNTGTGNTGTDNTGTDNTGTGNSGTDNTVTDTGYIVNDTGTNINEDKLNGAGTATGVNSINDDTDTDSLTDTDQGIAKLTGTPGEGNTDINTDNGTGLYQGKTVYLTFDDGPSIYSNEILDILAEYNVKATFFVIGKTDKASKEIYKRIVNEGHTLGMHSYTHKYDIIYNSVEDFDKDFTKLWKLLYDTTGYKPSIYRFPGGSENGVNKNGMEGFIRYLNDASFVYYDWNVLNGDATGIKYTNEQLIANVLDGVAAKKRSIVLMHDAKSKRSTVDTLPDLLEKLISEGAQILPLDKDVTPIQMIRSDSVN